MRKMISEQMELRPELPVVIQNKDYQNYKKLLDRMDEILIISGTEKRFIEKQLSKLSEGDRALAIGQARFQETCRKALRCNIGRFLLEPEYRSFSLRVADSLVLQRFCQMSRIDKVRGSSKSALERYDKFCTEEEIREIINEMNRYALNPENHLNLAEALKRDAIYSDATCVKAHIHFPIDWVLLRDLVRTCIKAIECIRRHGLKHRMPSPKQFLQEINRLCMGMALSRRKEEAKKTRKRILRKMKKVARSVEKHASRYLTVLLKHWEETDLTEGQMDVIATRLSSVLNQVPAAVKQAHERIIGERKVPNENKILSLYESDIHVIIRGKADAEVEFGNKLFLAEQSKGLILDWAFEKEQGRSEIELMKESLERQKNLFGKYPPSVVTDRGCWSKNFESWLAQRCIVSAICPKPPIELEKRLRDHRFRKWQKRRAQTEGRIGILKNVFIGSSLKSKGFEHRAIAVSWAILTHNLWKLANLPQAEDVIRKKAA